MASLICTWVHKFKIKYIFQNTMEFQNDASILTMKKFVTKFFQNFFWHDFIFSSVMICYKEYWVANKNL